MAVQRPRAWWGYASRHGGSREGDLAWIRKLALARVASWEAELAAGRRQLTPQLAAALAADRALADRMAAEIHEDPRPGEVAGGPVVRPGDAGQPVKGGADQEAGCFRP